MRWVDVLIAIVAIQSWIRMVSWPKTATVPIAVVAVPVTVAILIWGSPITISIAIRPSSFRATTIVASGASTMVLGTLLILVTCEKRFGKLS